MGDSDDEGTDEGLDWEGGYGFDDDVDACQNYHAYTLSSN